MTVNWLSQFYFRMKIPSTEAVKALKDLISGRNLGAGSRLPSARGLSAQTGFSRFVMDRACQELISQRLLVRKGYKLFVGGGDPARAPIAGEVQVLSYWQPFSRAAGRLLAELGVRHRVLELSFSRDVNPSYPLRKALAEKPAGVILWIPNWKQNLQLGLQTNKIPLVICTEFSPSAMNCSVVGTDVYRGVVKAMEHLRDLGHQRIALVSCIRNAWSRELADIYQQVCLQLNLRQAALTVWQVDTSGKSELRETLLEHRRRHPEITALFADSETATLATAHFKVPGDLSVVGLYEPLNPCRPALTTIALREQNQCMAEWSCMELIAQIRARESGRPNRPARRVYYEPELVVRDSTRALKARETIETLPATNGIAALPSAHPWESWRKIYPYLTKRQTHDWRQFNLTKLANHSMTRQHGWLGEDPLLHLVRGMRSIHGIPFQVIDENSNGGRAVVTFRSPHTHTTGGKQLPTSAKIAVNIPLKALYFLHGCGRAQPLPFAEYLIHFKQGRTARVPLLPMGAAKQNKPQRRDHLKPNLQDWWPENAQQDFPHARYVTIFDPADPQAYERYLYTLEWINPRPKDEISHIEVRVNPDAGPTLALIAVTALL